MSSQFDFPLTNLQPYTYGYLNDEVIILLHALGVDRAVIKKKQEDHFRFLADAARDPRSAFRFLSYVNLPHLAERVLLDSLESVQPKIHALVKNEYSKMLNKRGEQKCRILIPRSRLLFGVCDAWGVLKEGECAVKVTMDGDGQPATIKGCDVLVTRNPCLHPGDLQKFRAVERPELAHLVDCIVFSTKGRRPAADMMSGGDLDGDTCGCAFVVRLVCHFHPRQILTASNSFRMLGSRRDPVDAVTTRTVPRRQGAAHLQPHYR